VLDAIFEPTIGARIEEELMLAQMETGEPADAH
jgi:hypothetical protein